MIGTKEPAPTTDSDLRFAPPSKRLDVQSERPLVSPWELGRVQRAFGWLLASMFVFQWITIITQSQNKDVLPIENLQIDLNRATLGQLQLLPTIGPEMSQRIIRYRETHGGFESLADLENVPGIGPATIASVQPYVSQSRHVHPLLAATHDR